MDSRSGQSEARDARGLAVLATGHLWADFLQGSIPALIPFLIAERGYSYAAAGALVLASSGFLAAAHHVRRHQFVIINGARPQAGHVIEVIVSMVTHGYIQPR